MGKWLILLGMALWLLGCIQDGKDGADGRGYESKLYTGVLYSTDRKSEGSTFYWDKTQYSIGERSVVTVHVRQGSGFMWVIPTWYLSTTGSYVRIVDDSAVEPGWEYRIVVGN